MYNKIKSVSPSEYPELVNKWIVIRLNDKAPTAYHSTREEAIKEAIRLNTTESTDSIFFVCQINTILYNEPKMIKSAVVINDPHVDEMYVKDYLDHDIAKVC